MKNNSSNMLFSPFMLISITILVASYIWLGCRMGIEIN